MNTKIRGDTLQEISQKLDVVIAFLAARGLENNTAALVKKLADMGFGPKIIAPVVGTTENAIAIRLSRLRKKTPRKKASSAA